VFETVNKELFADSKVFLTAYNLKPNLHFFSMNSFDTGQLSMKGILTEFRARKQLVIYK